MYLIYQRKKKYLPNTLLRNYDTEGVKMVIFLVYFKTPAFLVGMIIGKSKINGNGIYLCACPF